MTNKALRLTVMLLAAAVVLTVFSIRSSSRAQNPPAGGGQQRPNPFDTGGRDDKPAGEVFKNIKVLKTLPAGQLGRVMGSFTRSLGVRCDHCHTVGQFDKDDLPAKQIAREMAEMTVKINNDLLKGIKGLSEKPQVSCYTCHRGSVKPETAIPAPQQGAPR